MLSQTSPDHRTPDKARDQELAYRLRQQTLLAEFGVYAAQTGDLDALLQRATEMCAEGMNAQFAKALEWLPQEDRLRVRAGVGWADGVVGTATVSADLETPAGFALHTGRPVISSHPAQERRFRTPPLLLDHGVKRAINVIVRGHEKGRPFGVLAADSPSEGRFDEADITFLQGFANLLGVAIERMRAERERDVERDRLRAVLDSLPVGVFIADKLGRIVESNAFMEKIWHGSASLPGGLADYDRYKAWWPDGRRLAAEEWALARAVRHGDTSIGEVVDIERFDCTRGTILKSAAPVRDPDGQIVGGVVAVQDLTERRQMEAALRRSEENFRTLANSIPQLAWMANADGWIFWYNDRWFDYTGTTLEAMEGWGWRKVHHPEHVGHVVERITRAWETGEPWEDTFPLRGKDGTYRWFLSRALPIRDDAGRVVRWFGTNTDVTEQREAEERQALLTREISHRVKNSLQIVAGLLGMQARSAKHADVRGALDDARTRVYAIAQVHDHLWKRGEVTNVDLSEFLASLCAGLQATAPQHRLVYEAEGSIRASTDRAIPVGLLLNELVTNAFKYAYPAGRGGEIRVRLSRSPPGRIRLEVADRGQGLPPGFDLQQQNGSLGVRLIDAFTRQLDGNVEALSSQPGARFVLDMSDAP